MDNKLSNKGTSLTRFVLSIFTVVLLLIACGDDKPNSPPLPAVNIELISPVDSQIVADTFQIVTYISDSAIVSKVEFHIDNELYQEVLDSPWHCQWSTLVYTDSSVHAIYAIAFNLEGKASHSDTIQVVVNNDSIAPNAISNLSIIDSSYSSLAVTWTATGDDRNIGNINSYDLRLNNVEIDSSNWDDAQVYSNNIPSTAPDEDIVIVIEGLDFSRKYYIAIKAIDEVGNESPISNTVSASTQSSLPITDLAVHETTDSSFVLSWTVPGTPENSGKPVDYEVRYYTDPIDESEWELAEKYETILSPLPTGSTEYLEITEFSSTEIVYFTIKVVDGSGTESDISNSVVKPVYGLFSSPIYIDQIYDSYAIGASDLNNDGEIDIVVLNNSDDNATIYLNSGGVFSKTTDYYTGTHPSSVCFSDFDKDGDQDMVISNHGEYFSGGALDNVAYMPNTGSATFQRFLYFVDDGPQKVIAADFNNDTYDDLAIANEFKDSVGILLNTGEGDFDTVHHYVAGDWPTDVRAADFDNDNDIDLAVSNWLSGGITIHSNNGNGVFSLQAQYDVGERPRSLCIGDFNLDGYPDIATANHYSQNISILLNNGNGGFNRVDDVYIGDNPYSIIAFDANNDNIPDLVVCRQNSNSGDVTLLLGSGDGTFTYGDKLLSNCRPLYSIAADFDNDNDKDMAVADEDKEGFYILLNTHTQ